MKVKDLLKAIQSLPPEADVYVWDDGDRLEVSMVDDSFLDANFIDINTVPVIGVGHKSIFVVANHNDNEIGRFDNRARAEKEALFYREQTGNVAYVEEQLA